MSETRNPPTSPAPMAPPKVSAHARGGPTDPAGDEELRKGIIHTQISRGAALALTGAFLLVIAAVPIAQVAIDLSNDEEIVVLDLFRRPLTKENLKQLEEDIDNSSTFRTWVQPRLQEQLTRVGRVGNKKAVVGHEGWLYYQPGVAFLAGHAFLDRDTIDSRQRAARMEAGAELHPDSRPAILAFAQALAARNAKLVLLPVPDKAMLAPGKLHGRWDESLAATPPRNPDLDRFVGEMKAAGVLVHDATPPVLKPGEPSRFLVQDTHWTPGWMKEVAAEVAALVHKQVDLPDVPRPTWRAEAMKVSRVGDIVDMLKLPEDQSLFAAHEVTIEKIVKADGSDWEPEAKADVLLLGDSFTNIFTQSPMGWGQSAGFAPHLARALGRPIDVIAQNDAGAFATRQLLSRELLAGEDRLAGKRVVIWQFAMRELGVGDWKPTPWPAPGAPAGTPTGTATPAGTTEPPGQTSPNAGEPGAPPPAPGQAPDAAPTVPGLGAPATIPPATTQPRPATKERP